MPLLDPKLRAILSEFHDKLCEYAQQGGVVPNNVDVSWEHISMILDADAEQGRIEHAAFLAKKEK